MAPEIFEKGTNKTTPF